MEETWRWFGPDDAVTLPQIRQTGATGIVTALHHVPYGAVWSIAEIEKRKALIAADKSLGLRWSVVESLPIHESIKLGEGNLTPLFDNYRQSMRNLAVCGVTTICYNFMPILDWTRTDLAWPLVGGGTSLKFDVVKYCAFDCFMVERKEAEKDHPPGLVKRADAWFKAASEADKAALLANVNAGLPGAYERYDIAGFRRMLARYHGIDRKALRANYARFLREIIPTAEEVGIRMAVHPDDPPRPLFGLPRIVSNGDDLAFIVKAVPSPANGVTFCTGSLGAGIENDVPALAKRFARHVHFAHLRNVAKESDGSFREAEHLGGDTDMVSVVRILLKEQQRRRKTGAPDWQIPFRPDHGHELLDDAGRKTHPGYPLIGRMRGLAEIRGVIAALNAREGFSA
ncbi:MAG: mannonate dehydratase [Beijerinckiaceae bacterium]